MGGRGSGRPKNPPNVKKMIKEIVPMQDIFDSEELSLYNDLVAVYLDDFDTDDLSSGDMDDIMDLAKNRVLELRLLKSAKDSISAQVDVSNAIEKIRKQNDKIKESLSSRRKDRIDPNEYKGFSIVNLAMAYDEDKKIKQLDVIRQNKIEQEKAIGERSGYKGNRFDADIADSAEEE